jgi:hypothetical protein
MSNDSKPLRRLKATCANQAHAVANIGDQGALQSRGIPPAQRANHELVLISEIGSAEAAVDNSHERAELQPQSLNELQQRASRLRPNR